MHLLEQSVATGFSKSTSKMPLITRKAFRLASFKAVSNKAMCQKHGWKKVKFTESSLQESLGIQEKNGHTHTPRVYKLNQPLSTW